MRGHAADWIVDSFLTISDHGVYYPGVRIMRSRKERGDKLEIESVGYKDLMVLITMYGSNVFCTDARDRVYALLSLLTPRARKTLALTPDYTKSTLEIFIHVVGFFRRNEDGFTRSEYKLKWAISLLQDMLCLSDKEVAIHL
jgi:hypothetical protein